MISFSKKLLRDLQTGTNVENYLIISLALVIIILDIFDLGNNQWINNATLAILALLAYGRISDRKKLENIEHSILSDSEALFLDEYPESLVEDMRITNELWIVGISLSRTIDTYYSMFQQKLEQGDKIRILLVSPGSEASELAANLECRPRSKDDNDHDILRTLTDFCRLSEISIADIELRTINVVFSFGFYAMRPSEPDGKIYAEHYSFKNDSGDVPKLLLERKDGYVYETFETQLLTLWEHATPWQCESNTE